MVSKNGTGKKKSENVPKVMQEKYKAIVEITIGFLRKA